jgi:hypothetical protein
MTDFNKKKPFKTPRGYFDDLEEQLCNSEDAISKLNPFSVPEHYFENLESSIPVVSNLETAANKKIPKNLILQLTSVAAVIIVAVTIIQIDKTGKIKKEQALNEFIENYYLEDLDSYEMLSMMEESEIEETVSKFTKP